MSWLLVGFALPVANALPTYDLESDFSATNNPAGAWSYGWSANLTSGFNLYTNKYTVGSIDIWNDPGIAVFGVPDITHNGTANTVTNADQVVWQPGQITLHPGQSGQYSIARWTAPSAGIFNIASSWTGVDQDNGTSSDVHILHNGVSQIGAYVNTINTPILANITNMFVNAGDVIDFRVGFGVNGNFYGDTTALSATITNASAVPEPTSLALFLIGGAAGYGWFRKKINK